MFMNKHTKGDENLYNENFLTLKKLRKELDDWKTLHAHGLTVLVLWKSLITESDLQIQHDPFQALNHSLQSTRKNNTKINMGT